MRSAVPGREAPPAAAQAGEQVSGNSPPRTASCLTCGQGGSRGAGGRHCSPFLGTCWTSVRYCDQFWAHKCEKKIGKLEWVQRKPPGCLGAGALYQWRETEGTGLVQPETDTASGGNQQPRSTYGEVSKKVDSDSLQQSMERQREATGIIWNKRFRLDGRKNFLPMRTTVQWKRLPRDAVQSPSLEVFKTQLDNALSNLIWAQKWPYFEQEFGLETSWGLSSLNYPMSHF